MEIENIKEKESEIKDISLNLNLDNNSKGLNPSNFNKARHYNKEQLYERGWKIQFIEEKIDKEKGYITKEKAKKIEEERKINLTYYKKELKDLGWTDSLIKKYLPTPDKILNLGYGKSCYLYDSLKVHQIIKENNLQEKLSKNLEQKNKHKEVRSEIAKKCVKKRTEKLVEEIEDLKIEVELIDDHLLRQFACDEYNSFKINRNKYFDFATINSDEDFLQRIVVNFIRHNLTSYDQELNYLFGKMGKNTAIVNLWKKIFSEIANVYPKYEKECSNQLFCKTGLRL